MGIINYDKAGKVALSRLLADEGISQANRAIVENDFAPNYHVSPARQEIVFEHLRLFLKYTDDFKALMQDEKALTKLLEKLKHEKAGYFETFRSVVPKFAGVINEGECPEAVRKAFKKFPVKPQRRDLAREDMLSWEDAQKLIAATDNMQLKAVLAVQLDCGFRPSEFIDLNYGDAEIKKDFVVFHVKAGKTGARDVIAWRSVPYAMRWLQGHPLKRKEAPMWVYAGNNKRYNDKQLRRYDYYALSKRIREIAARAGIRQPVDFYSLRHSSCFMDKLDNLPSDLAAERHGHSVEYFLSVYGRLDVEDKLNRVKRHYGQEDTERKKAEQNIICQRCDFVNTPGRDFCEKCAAPLSMKIALQQEQNKEQELQQLKEQINTMEEKLGELLKYDLVTLLKAKEIQEKMTK